MRTSVNNVSICRPTKAGGTGEMPVTPWVFWAVSAAMMAQPYAPSALMALTSARMPAPPEGSTPAMVSALGMGRLLPSDWGELISPRPGRR